jgi:hypothetical protein
MYVPCVSAYEIETAENRSPVLLADETVLAPAQLI